ncbi:MAG TPA: tetratricopeptide repeat protein [bacterium]|nr:tetratricopeptide repeat protein [bacterium]
MQAEEQKFRDVLAKNPDDAAARMGLARALLSQGRKVEAAEACEEAASLYVKRDRKDRAVAVYRRLLAIYKQMSRHAERVRVAQRMLELEPDDAHGEVHVALADALADAGDVPAALTLLREEVRMLAAVATLEILSNRASVQQGAAWKRTVTALERICALDRKDVGARIALARYQLLGKPARALATLLEVLTLDRRNVDSLRLIDHAFLAVGQFDRAARTYEEIAAVDPRAFDGNAALRDDGADLQGSFMLIDGAMQAGADEDALKAARALVASQPNRIPARRKLFELELHAKNLDAAMEQLSQAIALAIEAGDTDYGRSMLQMGLRVAPWHAGLREAAVRVTEHLKIFPG